MQMLPGVSDAEVPVAVAMAVKLSLNAPDIRPRLARALRSRLQHGCAAQR